MDRLNQKIRLRDGRNLGFAEYGIPKGIPIVYFHGWPSSRLEPYAGRDICAKMGVRLIAPDRPGFGLSDFQPRRTMVDFTNDVLELADNLDLQRFAALGVSGGGPYAAACAARIPGRMTATLLVCSVAPANSPEATKGMVAVNRWLLTMACQTPRLAQCVASICLWSIWGKGQQVIPAQIERRLPPADKQTLASPQLREALTASSVEALRRGVRAAAADGLLYGRPGDSYSRRSVLPFTSGMENWTWLFLRPWGIIWLGLSRLPRALLPAGWPFLASLHSPSRNPKRRNCVRQRSEPVAATAYTHFFAERGTSRVPPRLRVRSRLVVTHISGLLRPA
jgi:pimeloyl-ACP methyl ester carboxylesterase